jgi:hypothetical protein
MQGEAEYFVWEFLRNERPLGEMLTADYGFLNESLADLYGVSGVSGQVPQRVDLRDVPERGGLLTQASFLTITSHPLRTSPVARGRWVLSQLLCAPPPPPPPEVNPNLDAPDLAGLTLRERLERHRQAGSTCNACHAWMDPIGLGLENYDSIGAYRTQDEYGQIDASGELPGDPPQAFSGARELAQLIAADPRFERCAGQQLMTYGLGMKPSAEQLDEVLEAAGQPGEVTLRSVVRALVMGPAFRTRRGGGQEP